MVPPGSSEEVVQEIRVKLGTDRPILEQFWIYLSGLVQGDLGESFRYERPVLDLVLAALPATLSLGLLSIVLALVVSIPLGTLAAARAGSWIDKVTLIIAMLGQSLPNFWIGVMLVLLFSIRLQVLPAIGNQTASAYILPVITLSAVLVAALLRIVRQSVLEVLAEDFIRSARAKGVPRHRILLVHTLKNAAIPLVTVLGLQVGFVLGGAFVVELIYNWPGVGLLALQAIATRDFPVVQGVVMAAATVFVLANLLVDIAYAYLNPRIRLGVEQ
jgi:peptide/nickel transport system permease protein